jgi:hypothetical protein
MNYADEIRFLKMAIADINRRLDAERAYVTKMAGALKDHMKKVDDCFALVENELAQLSTRRPRRTLQFRPTDRRDGFIGALRSEVV